MVKTLFGEFNGRTVKKNKDVVTAAYSSYNKKITDRIGELKIENGGKICSMVENANEINKLTEELENASKEYRKLTGEY